MTAHATANSSRTAAKLRRQLDELAAELRARTAERDEALAQQGATTEVLGIINSSPGDLAPVFKAILDKAHAFCGATLGSLFLFDGELFCAAATHGYPEDLAQRLRQGVVLSATTQLLDDRIPWVHNPDLTLVDTPTARAVSGRGGVRTNLMLPLRKDGMLRGAISCNRREVRPFSEKETALLENFAAQAVIAIENARLLGELRERTDDLQESLEYQTATSDVLKVISRSSFDLAPVLDMVCRTARRLCGAGLAGIAVRGGEVYRYVATSNNRWNTRPRRVTFCRSSVARPSTCNRCLTLWSRPRRHCGRGRSDRARRAVAARRRAARGHLFGPPAGSAFHRAAD